MRTDAFGVRRFSSTRGVSPMSDRRLSATSELGTAGHGGQQDHGRAGLDGGVETVERPHVLALDVDVHERGDVAVLDELRAQPGETRGEVVQELAHGAADGGNLALATGLGAKRRWNADRRHACVALPWQ